MDVSVDFYLYPTPNNPASKKIVTSFDMWVEVDLWFHLYSKSKNP
jgi:hypothetical protein